MAVAIRLNHVTGLCRRKRQRALGISVKGFEAPFGLTAPLEQMRWIQDNQSITYPNNEHTRTILTRYDEMDPLQAPMEPPTRYENPFYADQGNISTSFLFIMNKT